MFKEFIEFLLTRIVACFIGGAVVFVGVPLAVPPICDFLLKEFAKEFYRQRDLALEELERSPLTKRGYWGTEPFQRK